MLVHTHGVQQRASHEKFASTKRATCTTRSQLVPRRSPEVHLRPVFINCPSSLPFAMFTSMHQNNTFAGSSCPVGLSKPLRSVLSNSCSAFVIQHHWHFDDVASLDWLRPIVCSAMAFLFIYEYIIVIKFALMSFNCILSFKGLFGDEDGWGEGFFGMWFIWIKYKSNIFYIWILYMKIL